MNRYRVTLTAITSKSFTRDLEAVDQYAAASAAQMMADREYPDADEIRFDKVELLEAAPEPTPDPLAQARDIIAGLLDAADHGVTELESLAVDALDDEGIVETRTLRDEYEQRSQDAWKAIEAARAFLASQEDPTCQG